MMSRFWSGGLVVRVLGGVEEDLAVESGVYLSARSLWRVQGCHGFKVV